MNCCLGFMNRREFSKAGPFNRFSWLDQGNRELFTEPFKTSFAAGGGPKFAGLYWCPHFGKLPRVGLSGSYESLFLAATGLKLSQLGI